MLVTVLYTSLVYRKVYVVATFRKWLFNCNPLYKVTCFTLYGFEVYEMSIICARLLYSVNDCHVVYDCIH
uniref:Uncharacterized protein n=1 Tax=Arundo donax TaxID=35708 RepID=A0A0A9DB08_ARUDO